MAREDRNFPIVHPLAQNTLTSALPVPGSFVSFEHLSAMDQHHDADFVICPRVC
jgi:hypothetical protein